MIPKFRLFNIMCFNPNLDKYTTSGFTFSKFNFLSLSFYKPPDAEINYFNNSFTLAEIAFPSASPANFFVATPITFPIS